MLLSVTTILTAVYPVWFAQSTLAHADIFAAAATLWALSYVFAGSLRDYAIAAVLFSVAALCKETAIAVPFSLAAYELGTFLPNLKSTAARPQSTNLKRVVMLVSPALPLMAWYAYHWHKTGFIFGNPEYLRYNAESTLTPLRILLAFGHRVLHITAYMNLFVPVICMFASMILPPLPENARELRPRVPFRHKGALSSSSSQTCFSSLSSGSLAHALLAPALSAHAAAMREYLAPPSALLAGAGSSHCSCVHRRSSRQPTLPLRA